MFLVRWSCCLLLVFLQNTISSTDASKVHSEVAQYYYVTPLVPENSTCPYQPCLMLSEYASEVDQYFVNESTFVFLPGTHALDNQLHIKNVSGIHFIAIDQRDSDAQPVKILFRLLANIVWTNCNDIEMSGFIFLSSGNSSQQSFYSVLVFEETTALLSHSLFLGNGSLLQWTAVSAESSEVKVSDVQVVGVTARAASALYAFNSTVDFVGNNSFVNNTATDGSTVALFDSGANFYGNASFIQNTAIPDFYSSAGDILCNNSVVTFNGTMSFQHNQATFTGRSFLDNTVVTSGAILIQWNSKVTFGVGSETLFSYNSAVLTEGAVTIISSELVVQGRGLFEGNFAIQYGGAVSGCNNSRVYIQGERESGIKFVNNEVYFNLGGAIDALTCDVELEKVYFQGNKAKFGGAVSSSSSTFCIKDCKFVRNSCNYQGGAMNVYNSSMVFEESNHFKENTAKDAGTLNVYMSNVTFNGKTNFSSNTAEISSGGIVFIFSTAIFNGTSIFHNNMGFSGGGMYVIVSSVSLGGNSSFMSNTVPIYGGGIMLSNSTLDLTGQAFFYNNAASYGPALYARNSIVTVGGNISVQSSLPSKAGYVVFQGAMAFDNSTAYVTGTLNLTNNTADEGGCIYVKDSEFTFQGCIQSLNNKVLLKGGVLFAKNSTVSLRSKDNCSSVFQNNSATYQGGAIYGIDSLLYMSDTHSFLYNSAERGGALALSGSSKLVLIGPLQVNFIQNNASISGGAIFYEDTFSISQCERLVSNSKTFECFIELINSSRDVQLDFINNTAGKAGTVLYGGNIDKCKIYIGGGVLSSCGVRIGGNYTEKSVDTFKKISDIVSVNDSVSEISSDPLQVCICVNESSLGCSADNNAIETLRGKEFTLLAVTVGQDQGIIPSSIRSYVSNMVEISLTQHIQSTGRKCTPLKYRLSSEENTTTLVLFPDGPCRDIGTSRTTVHVKFLPCPDDFILDKSICVCEERLQMYTTNCSVDDNSIERRSSMFWMGVVEDNNGSYQGLIIHPRCPFDYCVDTPVSIRLDNLDIQCNYNHSGMLCGSCKGNYSIALSTLHCLPCSNMYLALILPFTLAGVALVALLLLLNLSVATGTINGLIFYANVVQANSSVFYHWDKSTF